MPITLHLDQFPIVRATMSGYVSEAELRDHLALVEARVLRRGERFVIINDATGMMGLPTARARQMSGEWTLRNDEALVRYACGAVLVTDSPLVRGVLTAVQWIAPSRVERVSRPTVREAEAWAVAQLHIRGAAPRGDRARAD